MLLDTMTRPLNVALSSNGFALDMSPERLGWLTPSNPDDTIENLREQFKAQGYLWLKGLLPRAKVLDMRQRYFATMQEAGLLQPGTDPVDGIYGGDETPKQGHINKLMAELVRRADYEAFCFSDEIWRFFEALLDGAVYLHKRKLIRHVVPYATASTGAHYDLTYLRGGTDTVCTAWIPIGDTPVELGGLVYLEGSDKFGREQEAEFARKNADLSPEERISAYNKNMTTTGWLTKDLPMLANRLNSRWLVADYEAGDMMIHSAYMIHAATMNMAENGVIRLSTDIRYQRIRDEIDARWNEHWSLDDML
jgi:ectoine hydroxylase-related dioxygenase (phytanoyl-CoA dioxygenase family)